METNEYKANPECRVYYKPFRSIVRWLVKYNYFTHELILFDIVRIKVKTK